jgi:hypothetical protein
MSLKDNDKMPESRTVSESYVSSESRTVPESRTVYESYVSSESRTRPESYVSSESYKYCIEGESRDGNRLFKYRICRKVFPDKKECDVYYKKIKELNIDSNCIKSVCSLSDNSV